MKRKTKVIINGKVTNHEYDFIPITTDDLTPMGDQLLDKSNIRRSLFSNARAKALKAKFDKYFAEQDKRKQEYEQYLKEDLERQKKEQEEEIFRIWTAIYILAFIGIILYFIFK